MRSHTIARWVAGLALAAGASLFIGCDNILKVNNPEQLPVTALNDTTLLNAQVAGVISEFEDEYTRNNGSLLWSANFLTDEQVTGLNWEDYARVNQRIVNYTEGPVNSLWGGISRVVRLGEDVSSRIEALIGPDDRRLATTNVFAGYGYVYIGESMCQAVFGTAENPGTTVETPLEVFARAIPKFEKAIAIATATGQTDIVNLAHLGLARTYLNLRSE